MISCAECERGTEGTVASVGGDDCLRSRLRAMGVRPGTPVSVVRRSPFGDPIEISIRNVHLALRKEDAACIMLQTA